MAAPTRFVELPVSAATAYAQLQTAALAVELARDVSHLHGSFSSKQVKGTTQSYFSFREPDQRIRQIYVGPDSADVRALMARASVAAPLERLAPLARAALALGCAATQRKHLSVILRLGEYGFFRAGGVLVGTHAFLAFANLLGVRWLEPEQTADVDFAHAGRNLSIALPGSIRAEPHSALTTMNEGFLPITQFKGSAGASYRHRDEPNSRSISSRREWPTTTSRSGSTTSTSPCSPFASWSSRSKMCSRRRSSIPPAARSSSACPRPLATRCTSCWSAASARRDSGPSRART